MVNNYLYVSPAYRHLANAGHRRRLSHPDGAGGTLITVHVHVPPGMTPPLVVSAQQRYKVTNSGDGEGGTEFTLTLDVPES